MLAVDKEKQKLIAHTTHSRSGGLYQTAARGGCFRGSGEETH